MRWLVLLPLAGCAVGGGERDWSADVDRLELRLGSGEITVDTAPGITETLVHWEGGGLGDSGFPQAEEVDGVLRIDAKGSFIGGGEITVVLPEGVDVAVWLDRGEIDIALQAPANVLGCLAAGEVSIGVPGGAYRLDVPMAVGEVSVEGITHDGNAPYAISACVAAGELNVYALE